MKYKILLTLYHGTTKENAESILKNGYTELFLTNKASRAHSYGDCLVFFWKQFEFKTMVDKRRFEDKLYKTRFSSDFIDYVAIDNELKPLLIKLKPSITSLIRKE